MITLLQLKYFQELAHCGHLTQTAKKLYITQTALSSMIINLENELGIKLFDRCGRTMRLNEAGAVYLNYVNEIFYSLKNAHTALENLKENGERSVSFATASSHLWKGMIKGFRIEHPDYIIRQSDCAFNQFREKLISMELDYVIAGTTDFMLDDFDYLIIREERIYACVPNNHPFAGKGSITMAELKNEPFINLPLNSPFRHYCDSLFAQAGFECNAVLECDYTLRANLIEAGFGIAVTTQTAREMKFLGNNTYILISDSFARRPMVIVWNPKRVLSRAATDFKEYLVSYCKGQTSGDPAPA